MKFGAWSVALAAVGLALVGLTEVSAASAMNATVPAANATAPAVVPVVISPAPVAANTTAPASNATAPATSTNATAPASNATAPAANATAPASNATALSNQSAPAAPAPAAPVAEKKAYQKPAMPHSDQTGIPVASKSRLAKLKPENRTAAKIKAVTDAAAFNKARANLALPTAPATPAYSLAAVLAEARTSLRAAVDRAQPAVVPPRMQVETALKLNLGLEEIGEDVAAFKRFVAQDLALALNISATRVLVTDVRELTRAPEPAPVNATANATAAANATAPNGTVHVPADAASAALKALDSLAANGTIPASIAANVTATTANASAANASAANAALEALDALNKTGKINETAAASVVSAAAVANATTAAVANATAVKSNDTAAAANATAAKAALVEAEAEDAVAFIELDTELEAEADAEAEEELAEELEEELEAEAEAAADEAVDAEAEAEEEADADADAEQEEEQDPVMVAPKIASKPVALANSTHPSKAREHQPHGSLLVAFTLLPKDANAPAQATAPEAFETLVKYVADVASPLYKTEYLLDVDFTYKPQAKVTPYKQPQFVFANEVDPKTGLYRPRLESLNAHVPVVPEWLAVHGKYITPRYSRTNDDTGVAAVVPVVGF